jgi:FSR family fosmidomycin resistance protein-like MFS transporter
MLTAVFGSGGFARQDRSMPKAVAESAAPAIHLPARPTAVGATALPMLLLLSFCHLLNDTMSSLIPAIYPMLKTSYHLDFAQVGLITLAYQFSASLLQPLVGLYTDRHPQPYSLPIGMASSLLGILLLASATSYAGLIVAASMVGVGSSVFHPEASRVARMASAGRYGLAQSLFQVGGNVGQAIGPLLAAVVVLSRGQGSIAWFALIALLGIVALSWVGRWYRARLREAPARKTGGPARRAAVAGVQLSRQRVGLTVAVLAALIFSKFIYLTSLQNYLTFYLIQKFALSVHAAQLHLFMFLASVAVGTLVGGPIGDRIGRSNVIWMSIVGVLPFTLMLPYAGLGLTDVLIVLIGLILASAFPAILVYAQELMPGRVGLTAGLFFGLAFGLSGIGAAALGSLADATSISLVYRVCSYLPAIGLLAGFLPKLHRHQAAGH